MVSVSPRVIAAGVHMEKNKRVVRFTLALMPVDYQEGQVGIALEHWPEAIETLLAGKVQTKGIAGTPGILSGPPQAPWRLVFSPARENDASMPAAAADDVPHVEAGGLKVDSLLANGTADARLAEVGRLWTWVMSDGAGVPSGLWSALKSVIQTAGDGHRRNASRDNLEVAGVGRAESAFCLQVERAKAAIAATLRGRRAAAGDPVKSKVKPFGDEYLDIPGDASKVVPEPGENLESALRRRKKENRDKVEEAQKRALKREAAHPEMLEALKKAKETRQMIAENRKRFVAAGWNAAAAITALKEMKICPDGKPQAPGGYAPETLLNKETRKEALELLRGLHRAATAPDDPIKPEENAAALARVGLAEATPIKLKAFTDAGDPTHAIVARQMLFALRASPTLGRLFRFIVDVEVDADKLASILNLDAAAEPHSASAEVFTLAGCTLGANQASMPDAVWTITKFEMRRGTDGVQALAQAWPALREEMLIALWTGAEATPAAKAALKRKAVGQSNGLLRLGQTLELEVGSPLTTHRRYDLVTLDPIFAIDGHLRQNQLKQDRADAAASAHSNLAAAPEGEGALPFISRGLCVVDRWRQGAVVAEIVNAAHFAADGRIVDAEDLSTGYRLMLGFAGGVGVPTDWRSQMGRKIDYKDTSPVQADIEQALTRLGLQKDNPRRLMSDAASVVVPSRTRRRVRDDGGNAFCAHVEEILAACEGEPIALSCREEANDREVITAGSDIAVQRTYSLKLPGAAKPVPLRFGKACQVAVAPVWLGGVSIGNEKVAGLVTGDPSLCLPEQDSLSAAAGEMNRPFRRFLRHEPIMPPALLLPLLYAKRRDRYIRQTGPHVILRERARGETDDDRTSWRILIPPRMSIDDIWRHGVLDAEAGSVTLPKGGFLDVDIDAKWGDFPVYGRPAQNEPAGTPLPGRGKVPTPSAEPLVELKASWSDAMPGGEPPRPLPPKEQGECVFRSRRPGTRRVPYYPDPAAEQLVIALRSAGSSAPDGYFAGTPFRIDVSPGPARFREALAVVLHFERVDEVRQTSGAPLSHADFLAEPIRDGFTDGEKLASATFANAVRVKVVKIRLYQGEHVAADCWFVPRAQTMRRWFDLPETVVATSGVSTPPQQPDKAADELDKIFPKELDISARLKALRGLARSGTAGISVAALSVNWTAAGGVAVNGGVVAAVADAFVAAMQTGPVPQLAGVQTIYALHAVAAPLRRPAFDLQDTNLVFRKTGKVLAVTRYQVEKVNARKTLIEAFQKLQNAADSDLSHWQYNIPMGATGVLLAGKVLVDRDSCAQLEVVASVVAPQSAPIDSPARGRPIDMRLSGIWRTYLDADKPLRANYIFGFRVAADGRVELPTSSVTLLRIQNLDAWDRETNFAGLDVVDLAQEQLRALNDSGLSALEKHSGPQVTSFDPFKDSLARKLRLTLRVTGRYGEFLHPVVPKDPDRFEEEQQHTEFSVSESAVVPAIVDATEVWLPATRRPDSPKIHAVLPSFAWSLAASEAAGFATQVREPKLRVWIERPWFSSGEDERLGVVLWPPHIVSLASPAEAGSSGTRDPYHRLAAGLVPRRAGEGASQWMDLSDYADDVLGAAGKFVTRWGADPIREAPEHLGPFMTPAAFKDIPTSSSVPAVDAPRYVPAADMPIFPRAEGPQADNQIVEWLKVALITYEPRFDVDSERWYVDVALNPEAVPGLVEPFVRLGLVRYQEHAAPCLQVSAPTSAFAQVLPARTLMVWWARHPTAKQDGHLMAQVSGPYAPRADPEGNLVVPRMRFAAVHPVMRGGLRTETIVSDWQAVAPGAPSRDTSVQGNAWVAGLVVPAGTGAVHVLVEEDEDFLLTDDETIDDTGRRLPQKGHAGPRYAARLPAPRIPA